MNSAEECIYSIALTQLPGIGHIWAKKLVDGMGSATALFRQRETLPDRLAGVSRRIVELLNAPLAIARAEEELAFMERNEIRCLTLQDADYPARLRECDDAPIALFYKGSANLNALRVINMVGTRHATEYGKTLCTQFLRELKVLCPDVLVVSGLAYGIDIQAHGESLANRLPTVGVLAHGLDRIYPSAHRKTAVEMLQQGGLLTEFLSGSNPDKHNFVSRNRIVAGLSDATIVVESAAKGGALITADIAGSYHRDCFAFPGRTDALYSVGCNQLIRDNKASLLLSAEDFVQTMGWCATAQPVASAPVQRHLFPDLSEEEQRIVDLLTAQGEQQINALIVGSNLPVHRVSALLFELEMKGVVTVLAGGVYRLL